MPPTDKGRRVRHFAAACSTTVAQRCYAMLRAWQHIFNCGKVERRVGTQRTTAGSLHAVLPSSFRRTSSHGTQRHAMASETWWLSQTSGAWAHSPHAHPAPGSLHRASTDARERRAGATASSWLAIHCYACRSARASMAMMLLVVRELRVDHAGPAPAFQGWAQGRGGHPCPEAQ